MSNATHYVPPEQVLSPKASWGMEAVLFDGGDGGPSYAIGRWDNEPRLAFRWNGTAQNPIGNPQSRGLPTWTILDPKIYRGIIETLPPPQQYRARKFLDLTLKFDSVGANGPEIAMVSFHERPPLVVKLPCDVLSTYLSRELSSEQCRLVADVNKAAFADLAEIALLNDPVRRTREPNLDIFTLRLEDFGYLQGSLAVGALDLTFLWQKT